jgi:hypothetical protein
MPNHPFLSSLQGAAQASAVAQAAGQRSVEAEAETNEEAPAGEVMKINTPWFGVSLTGQNLIIFVLLLALCGLTLYEHVLRSNEHDELQKIGTLNNYLLLTPFEQRGQLANEYRKWIDEKLDGQKKK